MLHHLGLVPKLDIPTDGPSQGQNTKKFCTQSGSAPADLPRDVRRLLALYGIEVTLLDACPHENINALIRAQSDPVNRLIWVCQHLILLHNSELEVGSSKWSHPRVHDRKRMCACVRVCACACVRARVCVCARVRVHARVCV